MQLVLCNAVLRQKAGSQRHTSIHGYSCTHTRQMKGLTLKFNACIGKCAHVCFGERAEMTVHTSEHLSIHYHNKF